MTEIVTIHYVEEMYPRAAQQYNQSRSARYLSSDYVLYCKWTEIKLFLDASSRFALSN